MDFRQLEYIIAIAEYGSINKAAEALYITQSGLNQQLLKLEKELQSQLFHRSKHYLHPTEAGEVYLKSAREILKIKSDTYSKIGDLNDNITGEISIGITYEHGVDMFIHIFPEFNQRYPGITIKSMERTVKQQQAMIANERLDIGFVILGEQDKTNDEYVHLCNERLVLGVPVSHRYSALASKPGEPLREIDLALFKDEQFALMFSGSTMRKIIDPLFETAGFQPKILFESTVNHALFQMVNNGLCCSIIPQSYAKANDKVSWFYPVGQPYWEFAATYAKDKILDNAKRYIIQLALEYGQTLNERLSIIQERNIGVV